MTPQASGQRLLPCGSVTSAESVNLSRQVSPGEAGSCVPIIQVTCHMGCKCMLPGDTTQAIPSIKRAMPITCIHSLQVILERHERWTERSGAQEKGAGMETETTARGTTGPTLCYHTASESKAWGQEGEVLRGLGLTGCPLAHASLLTGFHGGFLSCCLPGSLLSASSSQHRPLPYPIPPWHSCSL